MSETGALKQTPLHELHIGLGAKMVPFAGYDMPVQYPMGVMKEHLHCRAAAGLFDVSHMGQVILRGASYEAIAKAFETLVPMDVLDLPEGKQRYGFFTNDNGGIEDDLMFANRGDHLFVVVNAACKEADVARMKAALEPGITIELIEDRALIALQGPAAETALARLNPAVADMVFMDVATVTLLGQDCWVSRSGYTGEDGYEISVPAHAAETLCQALLAMEEVAPIGLGARDSLRLEAGLCLYGNDITTETGPVEAALTWAMQKVRRAGGDRAGGFPGAGHILGALAEGVARKRVGLLPEGRAPMRDGTQLFAAAEGGEAIGEVTSGSFGPSIGGPVAMGYVGSSYAAPGTQLFGEVRGKRLPLTVAKMPLVPANFKR
ncbi:glycine cleavage system aminomethyltransferase GcvT [Cognatishimia sp. SS12]|uniref:glycine cleavage system aminomethyltransferase GcvT n=1 Tax=Cognatishimia sp. SS12 TaxID=2979465 RepID=UPI00232B9ABB|nr:glycine cleavage system aminomethyltransferase GcvT [Cognatishimia sp. SS12]MDC0738975.1 glycine cleavage system aminomethyltransferase GcvT [Cognatishimia sp. SS12]